MVKPHFGDDHIGIIVAFNDKFRNTRKDLRGKIKFAEESLAKFGFDTGSKDLPGPHNFGKIFIDCSKLQLK